MKRKLLSMALLAVSALGFHANAQQYEDGADLTNLIVNPGFEEAGGNGWKLDTSKGGTANLTNWHGGSADNYCAEAYEQNFDVYQIIEGVPDGLYEVSVQAFYRTGTNEVAWAAYQSDPNMEGEAKVYPEVYLNEFSTKVRNVMEIQFADGELDANNTNAWETPNKTYTLNGMTSASNAFSLDDSERNFTMPAYGLVTDGKIRLGIRKLDGPTTGSVWTLWDNFKLTYRAKNATALTSVIESMVAQYRNYADLNTEYINVYESGIVDAAIKAANEAIGKDGDTMYDALIALNDAYNGTKAHVAAETSLKAALEALENALANEEARQDDLDAGEVLKDEDIDNYKITEIEDLIERIYKAIAAINYPRFDLATMEKPRSATALIVNPGFETGDLTGWVNNGTIPAQTQSNNDLPAGVKQGTWYAEKWHVTGTIDLSQTINELPAGVYEVRAYAYSDASDAVLYAEKSEVSISTAQQYRISNIILEDESNSLTFGVKWSDTGSHWTTFDVFELWYYGSAEGFTANAEDYEALNAAIAAAEKNTLGFDAGEYAPYNNIEALSALNAAKAINQEATNLKADVNEVTEALTSVQWEANDEEVNAIYDGSFATEYSHDGNVQPVAWVGTDGHNNSTDVRWQWNVENNPGLSATSTSKALFTKYGAFYGKEEGYTMPLKANTYYKLTFIYGGWDDCKNDGYVTITGPNNESISVIPSELLRVDATDCQKNSNSWKEYEAYFKTEVDGNYILGLLAINKDGEGHTAQSQYAYGDFDLRKVSGVTTVEISAAGYATFSSELPLDLSQIDGGTAYIVADDAEGEYIKLTEQTEAVPANTGLIIAGEGTVTIPVVATANPLDKYNYLVAVNKETTVESGYVLSWDGSDQTTVGFYVVDETPATVKAGQAYLSFPAAEEEPESYAKVLRFVFGDGTATAVEAIEVAEADADGAVYNVAGQQVGKDYKGIVIKNGKKYLNK